MAQYMDLVGTGSDDIVSMHIYKIFTGLTANCAPVPPFDNERFGSNGKYNADVVSNFHDVTEDLGKPLYVGEFGDIDFSLQANSIGEVGCFIDAGTRAKQNFILRYAIKALGQRVPVSTFWSCKSHRRSSFEAFLGSIHPDLANIGFATGNPDSELATALAQINQWLQTISDTPGFSHAVPNGGFEDHVLEQPEQWEFFQFVHCPAWVPCLKQ